MPRPLASASDFTTFDRPRLAATQTAELSALCAAALAGDDWLAVAEHLAAIDPRLRGEVAACRAAILAHRGQIAEARAQAAPEPRVADAEVAGEILLRAGDVTAAVGIFEARAGAKDAAARARSAAALAEALLFAGEASRARSAVASALDGDFRVPAAVRARVDLALAAIEIHDGRTVSARAALSRAARAIADDPAVEILRAECLLAEGRVPEAERAAGRGRALAEATGEARLCAAVDRIWARIQARAGNTENAAQMLEAAIDRLRDRGDETAALEAELELCATLADAGFCGRAKAQATACARAARASGHGAIARAADVCATAAEAEELAPADAAGRFTAAVSDPALATRWRIMAARLAGTADAAPDRDPDGIRGALADARAALARGDRKAAIAAATRAAADADRAGLAIAADALALWARLSLAADDRVRAEAAATRALALASEAGRPRALAEAALCLAACAEASGDRDTAKAHAERARTEAGGAGLAVLRLAAAGAEATMAGAQELEPGALPAAATMTKEAVASAGAWLTDLGLTTARPYRVVDAAGAERRAADVGRLRMGDRALAIDGIGENLYRDGKAIASLRRRSLLKRLLFLFAAAPGETFSKEAIVERVWEVEYHPLRHDAALFTNIMRARRLFGDDGADLIRVGENGYRFCPPEDFIFVTRA